MKVYDIWCSDMPDIIAYEGEQGWVTSYGDSLDEVSCFIEEEFPGSDWIIIENELPF